MKNILRCRLNHGPKKCDEKDDSEVKKKLVAHIKETAKLRLEQSSSEAEEESIQKAKEAWGKSQTKKNEKKFSYFKKTTLLSTRDAHNAVTCKSNQKSGESATKTSGRSHEIN